MPLSPTSWPGSGGSFGAERVYTEFTGTVSVTATVEASADVIVTAAALAADGTSAYLIEFWSQGVRPDNAGAGRFIILWLFEDGTSIGNLGTLVVPAAQNDTKPVLACRRRVPAAGSRTYSIRATVSAGTGSVAGGAGGAGTAMPGFIRITQVA